MSSHHHHSREHSPQPSSNPENNDQHSTDHPSQPPIPDETMNTNPNPANASFTFAYHLDPITNSLVRTPIPLQQDEHPDLPTDPGIAIQATTNVTLHALDDDDDGDSPSSPSAVGGPPLGVEAHEQEIPHELVDSIMNTISAMMGVVPNGTTPSGQDPNSETPIESGRGVQPNLNLADITRRTLSNNIHGPGFMLHSTSLPNLSTTTTTTTTSTAGSSAPIATTSTITPSNLAPTNIIRPTFIVEDMEEDEFADMPGLLEPSPGSSVANTPLEQTPESTTSLSGHQARTARRNENSNLMQTLMEAAAAERQQRQNDSNDPPPTTGPFGLGSFSPDPVNPALAAANPTPNPPTANPNPNPNAGNANPNPIRFARLNASDLRGAGANLFGFPGGLMGGLMGLGIGGAGAGVGGIPLSMLTAERPPDTRRAKELLKGLTVVPHGLVRRLERVESLKDKLVKEKMRSKGEVVESVTKSEGNAIGEGRLLCPVCYEALLPDPDAKEGEEEGENEETMDVDEEDEDEMDTKPDSSTADPALPTPPLTTTTTVEKGAEQVKHKQPKHPYQQPNALIALPCTHIFHASSCLKPWFETGKTTCPTCRFDIDPRSETLDLSWLQNAARRRAAANANPTGNNGTGNTGAAPAANEANANAPPTDATPGINVDANPNANPNTEPNPNGNGNPEGADFRQVFTTVLRNAIAQAMTAALLSQPGQQPQTPQPGQANQGPPPQPPTLQTQGLQSGLLQTQGLQPGLRTPGSQPGSREGTRPPPSPQALAFQRAFDAQQHEHEHEHEHGSVSPRPPPSPQALAFQRAFNAQQHETASQIQGLSSELPAVTSYTPAAPNAEPSNPPPPTTAAANPTPAEGAPRVNYDVLVRDIFLADQGDGQMEVFTREMVMPHSIIPGFDWSDMPVGPGPSAAPSNNNNIGANGGIGGEGGNTNLENRNAAMEGVEATNATPSAPSNSAGPSPSRFTGFGQGLRGAFTTRRAAYLTPDGVYVPAEPRASPSTNSSSSSGPGGGGSSGTRQASTSTDPSASQESSSAANLSPPTSNPSRPRTPLSSATRHHPYASPRASNLSPAPSASSRGIGSDEPSPNPFTGGTSAENPATGNGNQDNNLSFSRHSITFSFSFGRGPDGQFYGGPIPQPPPPTGNGNDNANTTPGQNNNEARPDRSQFMPEGFMMGGDILFGVGPPPFGLGLGTGGASPRTPRANRPKKKWVSPEGTSLRSVVEAKEREVGLRCDDVSCLWGPEDDDDLSSELKIREARVWLKKRGSDGLLEPSCAHRFHSECILVASRVADQHLDEEIMQDGGDEAALVEAACPFCRARGALRREEWKDAKEQVDAA